MVLKTKEENRTNAHYKPLRLRAELVHLFPLVVQKLSSLIITEFTKYKSNSLPNYRSMVIEPAVAELAEASKYSRTVPEVLEGTPIPS